MTNKRCFTEFAKSWKKIGKLNQQPVAIEQNHHKSNLKILILSKDFEWLPEASLESAERLLRL